MIEVLFRVMTTDLKGGAGWQILVVGGRRISAQDWARKAHVPCSNAMAQHGDNKSSKAGR